MPRTATKRLSKTEVIRRLKSKARPEIRKVYLNHEITGSVLGVTWGDIGTLRKEIKKDHDLALSLWASGHFEARALASMIVDPERVKVADLEAWLGDVGDAGLSGILSEIAYQTPGAHGVARKWRRVRDEWKSTCGWNITGHLASHDESADDDELAEAVAVIEKKIHSSPNRTREAMNNALISIGRRNARLKKVALAAAKRIGPVDVDHGKTSCKTPDAVAKISAGAKRR